MAQDIDPLGVRLFVLLITSLVLIWTSILLRALAKSLVSKRVSLDDWLMFLSVLIFSAHAGISIWGIVYASKEAEVDHPRSHSIALHAFFLGEIIYPPLSALIRTSIAVFLLRIATVRAYRLVIYANLVVTWNLCIVYFFLFIFQCTPTSHFYMQVFGQPGSCIAPETIPHATIVHSILSALTDFTLAALPVAIIWGLPLERKSKIGIAAMLGMGFFAGAALIIRIPYVRFTSIASPEFLDQTNGAGFWSVMETSLGIVAGCLATLRPLLRFRAGHQQRDELMSTGARRVEWHQGQYAPRTARDIYPLPESPTPENRFYSMTGTSSVPDIVPKPPSTFESDYLDRLSKSRAWVKRISKGGMTNNPRPSSCYAEPYGVHVRTDIEATSEILMETGRAIPLSSPARSEGRHVVSIHGLTNPDRSTHGE